MSAIEKRVSGAQGAEDTQYYVEPADEARTDEVFNSFLASLGKVRKSLSSLKRLLQKTEAEDRNKSIHSDFIEIENDVLEIFDLLYTNGGLPAARESLETLSNRDALVRMSAYLEVLFKEVLPDSFYISGMDYLLAKQAQIGRFVSAVLG